MIPNFPNIRPNLVGDTPEVHPTAIIDPSAQIIGNVKIGKNVFVAPLTVIRADEPGPDGIVAPIILEEEVNIQDGVIMHTPGGAGVIVGANTTIAHGATVHGPCHIKEDCFVAMRATVYKANLEPSVWIGMNATIMQVNLDAYTYVPAGFVINSQRDAWNLRFVTEKEKGYMKHVLDAAKRLRDDYRRVYGDPLAQAS